MATGLLMQAAGLAGVALLANPHAGFGPLSGALILAGSGTSMVFPAVASEVVTSVPPGQIGIASGTNNSLRELGGVFGVAVLAAVFTRPGVYASASTFAAGFSSALWVAVALSFAGILLTLPARRPARPAPQPDPAEASAPIPALPASLTNRRKYHEQVNRPGLRRAGQPGTGLPHPHHHRGPERLLDRRLRRPGRPRAVPLPRGTARRRRHHHAAGPARPHARHVRCHSRRRRDLGV